MSKMGAARSEEDGEMEDRVVMMMEWRMGWFVGRVSELNNAREGKEKD